MTARLPTSLRTRVVAGGLAVLAIALAGASVAVYLAQRVVLEHHLDEVLAERMELVRDYADIWSDPDELADVLGRRGIRAEVSTVDGRALPTDPQFPRVGSNLPVPPGTDDVTVLTGTVGLPDGGEVAVSVSRDGVDATLDRLLSLELLTAAIALPLAGALLYRTSRHALRPLDDLVATANRIAEGDRHRRLGLPTTTTELGRAGAAFDQMLDQLQEAVDQAQAAEQATRDFLGSSAHQLKTPIASAGASVQALLHETSPERRDELLLAASRETDRAARMVHGLLRLANLDHGMQARPVAADLVPLLSDEHARAARRAPHLDVALDVPDALMTVVDPFLTAEITANLLDNAARHAVSRVTLHARRSGEVVSVEVTDDGPGVAAGDVERIFERFVSVGHRGGTGLGLPIARGLARLQDGEVAHVDGRFRLTLPASRDRSVPSSDDAHRDLVLPTSAGRPPR